MSDTQIDKLSIEIEASAKGSTDVFKQLTEALSKLQSTISSSATKLNGTKGAFDGTSKSVDGLTKAVEKSKQSFRELNSLVEKVKDSTGRSSNMSNLKDEFSDSKSNAIDKMTNSVDKLGTTSKGTAFSIATLVAKVDLLIVGAKKMAGYMKSAATEAMDYIEDFNLFKTTMGEYAEEAYNFGEKASTVLGIDIGEWIKNQGVLYTIINGFGVASDKANIMSQNLTQLGYDIASFFNLSTEESMQKVMSGISGELEPLRRIGYDLSVARLQVEATNLKLDKSVSSMTQAEKAALRYYTMMSQVTVVQGDMARTLQSPANQLRILRSQFRLAAREVGNLVIPIINNLLPVLIAVARAIRKIADAIAGLFGVELPTVDFSDVSNVTSDIATDLGDISDDADGTASGLGRASENAKKLKSYLLGIDELNVLEPEQPSTSSGGSSRGKSGGNSGGIDIGDMIPTPTYDFLSDAIESKIDDINSALDKTAFWLGTIASVIGGLKLAKFLEQFLPKDPTFLQKLGLMAGSIMSVGGAVAYAYGLLDAFMNGLNWKNFAIRAGGAATSILGVWLATKNLAGGKYQHIATGLVSMAYGVSEIALALKDIKRVGLTIDNTVTLIMGLTEVCFGLMQVGKQLNKAKIFQTMGLDMGKILGSIGVVVAGLMLFSQGITDIAKNGPNVTNVLVAIGGAVATVIGSFVLLKTITGSLVTGVFGALIAGVVLLVTWFMSFGKAQKEAREEAWKSSTDYDVLIKSVDKAKEAAENATTAYDNFKDKLQTIDDVKLNYDFANELKDKIFDLNSKKNLTQTEIEVLQEYIREFNNLNLDGVQIEFDETTKHIKQTRQEIENAIEASFKQARIDAYLELVKENNKEIFKLQQERKRNLEDYANIQEIIAQKEQRLNELRENEWDRTTEEQKEFEQLQHELYESEDNLIKKRDEMQQHIEDSGETILDYAKDNEDLKGTLTDLQNTVGDTTKEFDVYNDKVTDASGEVQSTLEEMVRRTGYDLGEIANRFAQGGKESANKLTTYLNKQTGIKTTTLLMEGLLNGLRTGKLKLNDVASKLGEDGMAELLQYINKKNGNKAGTNLAGGVADGINANAGRVESTASNVANRAKNALNINTMEVGKYFIEGFTRGMSNNSGLNGVIGAATSMAKAAQDTVKKVLDIHSPSRVMYSVGEFFSMGLANGIEDAGELAVANAEALSKKLTNVNYKFTADDFIQDDSYLNGNVDKYVNREFNVNSTASFDKALEKFFNGKLEPYMKSMSDDMRTQADKDENVTVTIGAKVINDVVRQQTVSNGYVFRR